MLCPQACSLWRMQGEGGCRCFPAAATGLLAAGPPFTCLGDGENLSTCEHTDTRAFPEHPGICFCCILNHQGQDEAAGPASGHPVGGRGQSGSGAHLAVTCRIT